MAKAGDRSLHHRGNLRLLVNPFLLGKDGIYRGLSPLQGLFTQVPRRGPLGTSPLRGSRKFALPG